jgi:hypothetical protein
LSIKPHRKLAFVEEKTYFIIPQGTTVMRNR